MKELDTFREFLSEGKMDKFKVGQTVKYKADGKEKEGEIEKIDGIYLKLKSGGSIPYQSVLEEEQLDEIATPQQMMSDATPKEDKLDTLREFRDVISDLELTGIIKPGGMISIALNKIYATLLGRVK